MSPYAIIFDFDGVILDSGEFHFEAWKQFVCSLGARAKRQVDEDFFRNTFGQRNDEIIPQLVSEPLSPEEIDHLAEEKEAQFREAARGHLEFLPGVESFLEELCSEKVPRIIASSTPRSNMEFFFEELGLTQFFETFLCGNDVSCGKPHPEIFIKAAQKLGYSPDHCVVIEDSFAGIEAAFRAKISCVAVATTRSRSDLESFGKASLILDGTRDLKKRVFDQLMG